MSRDFVGDRFVRIGPQRWRDIATGGFAEVTIREHGSAREAEECAIELSAGADARRPALIDYGWCGAHWFEARAGLASWPRAGETSREGPGGGDVSCVVEQIVRTADVATGAGVRCIRGDVADSARPAVASEAARRLRALGFVVVDAEVSLPRPIEQQLAHRHIALLARERCERAAMWVRRLASASPRAHVLVVWTRAAGPGRVSDVRAVYGIGSVPIQQAGLRRRSADASVTAARLIAGGELERAESLLSSVAAESILLGAGVEEATRIGLAQVHFWQGRFEEAEMCACMPGEASAESVGWRGLTAWARRDSSVVRETLIELEARAIRRECGASFWRDGLALIATGALGRPSRALRDAEAFLARSRLLPVPDRILGRALAIEALLVTGNVAAARRAAGPPAVRRPRPGSADALESALVDWLRVRCSRTDRADPPDRLAGFVRRSGAYGLHRWGLGRGGMNVLDGLTALLELVHDADDEHVALKRGCSWVREHAGAEGVGIVTNEGSSLVVGDGLARADLEASDVRASLGVEHGRTTAEGPHAVVTAPVRYGGVTIGFAVIKGRRETATTLAEAGAALASACAPALRARLDALALSGSGQALASEILGASPSVAAMREAIARSAGTAFSVLIEGESGTGKELVARAVHRLSARRDRRLCAINCAALTDELVEAELFGYVRGAFTGAVGPRTGLFEEAHGGTLFLDEVSELSARGQAKLLRVLQEREIRRLGENGPRPVDVRVVAATNQPLADAVGRGRFREDLLFRLAVVRIRVPPLRDRIEDVPLLAHAFWRKLVAETGKRVQMGSDAVAALCRYSWPGNVRELQNVAAALVVAAPTRGRIGARHVEAVLAEGRAQADAGGQSLDAARQAFERRMVAAALARHGGRRTRAAVELGISRQGLTKAIKRLGLGGVA